MSDYNYKSEDAREGRYYGFLSGVVTNISDPQKLGRVKARLQGQGDNDESDWLVPMWPGSMEALPFKDDPVMVGFVDGDPNKGFWAWHPHTSTKNRPTEAMVLGTTLTAMYNDLAAKFNDLQQHYQAFYLVVQTHGHAALGSASVALLAATIDPTCKDTGTATGKGKDPDGAVVAAKSGDQTVLSKNLKLR
jgi:hypothetical protein